VNGILGSSLRLLVLRMVWMVVFPSAGLVSAAEVPPWWPYEEALKPQWRMQGEKLASIPEKRAEGELILARFYGVQGDLPREILHLNGFFASDSKDASLQCLGWHEKAAVLRQLGEDSPRQEAIENYGRFYTHEFAILAGLESPKVMEAWRLIDRGQYQEAEEIVNELSQTDEAKTDDSMLASLGLLRSEIEGRKQRDPKLAKDALLKLMDRDQIGPEKFLADPNLVVAAVVSEERLFQPEDAVQLIAAASQGRKIIAPVIPEAEMARNELMLCNWDDAANFLAKAQRILLTYPPCIRQEAGKNLDFAVADYYLASGHPYEALPILERLRGDFLRPGFTTEDEAYYLAGLHLRIRMASDRILRLQLASARHAEFASSSKALSSLARLLWVRLRSEILFRQELANCCAKADPGRDIGTLIFVPPWMLPEMRNILGGGTFNGLFSTFHPVGRRLEVLQPFVMGHGSIPNNAPPLLKALALASSKTVADRLQGWQIAPSATLLAGSSLPVAALPDHIPPCGWLEFNAAGMQVDLGNQAVSNVSLSIKGDQRVQSLPNKWPETPAGRIEVLNKALINVDSTWGQERQFSVEGRNLAPTTSQVVP